MYNYEFQTQIRAQHQELEIRTCAHCKRRREIPINQMLCTDCVEDAAELQRSYRVGGVYADSPSDCGGS